MNLSVVEQGRDIKQDAVLSFYSQSLVIDVWQCNRDQGRSIPNHVKAAAHVTKRSCISGEQCICAAHMKSTCTECTPSLFTCVTSSAVMGRLNRMPFMRKLQLGYLHVCSAML